MTFLLLQVILPSIIVYQTADTDLPYPPCQLLVEYAPCISPSSVCAVLQPDVMHVVDLPQQRRGLQQGSRGAADLSIPYST